MDQQEKINWLIRQVNRMNNSHCGDGCDYTVSEECVVWTGEPLVCGETVLANEGDRMDVVQQNIVAMVCENSTNTCCNLKVNITPVSFPSPETPFGDLTPNAVMLFPSLSVTGGMPPYTYKWTQQQFGGTNYTLVVDDTADIPMPLSNFPGNASPLLNTTPMGLLVPDNTLGGTANIPQHARTEATLHAIHLKLEVTDANGCSDKDYWTWYAYNTY